MVYEAFWGEKNVFVKAVRYAHLIKDSRSETVYDPLGIAHDSDIYNSYCGMERWTRFPWRTRFGRLEEAIKDGTEVCKECLEIKNKLKSDE